MATYKIDALHSQIGFKVKHLMISSVGGQFDQFAAEVNSNNEDFTDASITFTADVNSINTKSEQRDTHLKSPDFFDAEKFPQLSFASSSFQKTDAHNYILNGNLTIKGVEKPVKFDVVYSGKMVDFYGNEKHGFEIIGGVSRKDFGLEWNAVTEAGGIVVGDEIKMDIHVQFQKM